MAGAAVNTFRQLGMTLGIALLGAVFSDRVRAAAPDLRAGYASGIDRVALWSAIAATAAAVAVLAAVRTPAPAAHPAAPPAGTGTPDTARPPATRTR
jgi:hypothetical protein